MFRIVIDSRESLLQPLVVAAIRDLKGVVVVEQLPLGDLLLKDKNGVTRVMVERKTIADLLASIKDGRYKEQSFRLAQCFEPHNVLYVIEGPLPRSSSSPSQEKERRVVLSAMSSLYFEKGFGVWHTSSAAETAERVVNLAHKINDNQLKKNNFGHYTVSSVSSVSSVSATSSTSCLIAPAPSGQASPRGERKRGAEGDDAAAGGEESPAGPQDVSAPAGQPSGERKRERGDEGDAGGEEGEGAHGEKRYSSVVKCVKQANVTPENITEIMLMQIPTVSSAIAAAIARRYATVPLLVDALRADPACLAGLTAPNIRGKHVRLNKNALAAVATFLNI